MNFENLIRYKSNVECFCECGEIATEHYTTESHDAEFHFCEFCCYQNDENLYNRLKDEDCFEKHNLRVNGYQTDSCEIAYDGIYFIFQDKYLIDTYESEGYDDENISTF